jgi:hypothetical protein
MSVSPSAKALVSVFSASSEVRPVVLLGAGASFRSGVPLAAESVKRIAKAAYIRHELGGKAHPSQVKLSQWLPWLQGQSWFIQGDERLAENFPLAVQHLLRPDEFRREVLLDLIQPLNGVSAGYHVLADFMLRGLVWTVLTTNFDPCFPAALRARQPHLKQFAQVNRGRNDFAEFSTYARRQLVWLHGCAEQYTDRNERDEVSHLDTQLVSRLRSLIDDSPLVVIGYRGAELSVMDDLLMAGLVSSLQYRQGIYWCVRRGESLHQNVERLALAVGRNFHKVEIEGFDELMGELATELKGEDLYAAPSVRIGDVPPPQAFDEQPMVGFSLDGLDTDLMLSRLGDYCRTLGRAPVTSETLLPLLRELGLVRAVDGIEVPTVGCCLLFAKVLPPQFEHAAVALTRAGKKRTIVGCNLLQQLQELKEWIDSEDVNPALRVKGRRTYTERTAYPARTLTELLVNLLVHRDYQTPELAEIDVDAGRAIRFHNPADLGSELRGQLHVDDAGRFKPVRSLSEIRNPSIADVFFGIRSMERAGTGLADVEDEIRRAGGDVEFTLDGAGRAFRATLYQPLQAAPGVAATGATAVARPVTPMGLYVLNNLPITVVPAHISIAPLRSGAIAALFQRDLRDFPLFVSRGDEIWSLAPAATIELKLGTLLDGQIETPIRTDVEKDEESRKVLSWLLRKHWEWFLRGFRDDGLLIESRKNRAYFTKLKGRRAQIAYSSPKRRHIQREVVKARGEQGAWHENEGIGYQVIWSNGQWAIRVKPFYMFTGRDGVTPLPGYLRTRHATRRIKFDRNRNVDDDLTFWMRYLGSGQPTINLGGVDVEDLIADAAFVTFEVIESGLLEEASDGRAYRVPA